MSYRPPVTVTYNTATTQLLSAFDPTTFPVGIGDNGAVQVESTLDGARSTGAGYNFGVTTLNDGTTDYRATARVFYQTADLNHSVGVAVRHNGAAKATTNNYVLRVIGNGNWDIREYINGAVARTIASGTGLTIVATTRYDLSFEIKTNGANADYIAKWAGATLSSGPITTPITVAGNAAIYTQGTDAYIESSTFELLAGDDFQFLQDLWW